MWLNGVMPCSPCTVTFSRRSSLFTCVRCPIPSPTFSLFMFLCLFEPPDHWNIIKMSQPNKEYDVKQGKSSLDSNQNPIPNDDPVLHNQSDTEMKQTSESFRPISKSSSLGTGSKLTRDACTSPLNWDSTGKEFDDYMKKLSHWVWQCHQWHFFYNHASISLASGNLPVGVNLPASARPTETNRTEASPRSAHPTNPTQPPGQCEWRPRCSWINGSVGSYFFAVRGGSLFARSWLIARSDMLLAPWSVAQIALKWWQV